MGPASTKQKDAEQEQRTPSTKQTDAEQEQRTATTQQKDSTQEQRTASHATQPRSAAACELHLERRADGTDVPDGRKQEENLLRDRELGEGFPTNPLLASPRSGSTQPNPFAVDR